MRLHRLLVFAAITCFCVACDNAANDRADLNWDKSVQIESIEWKIDGVKIGVGVTGYKAVITKLESLNRGSVVTISYPSVLWNEGIDKYVMHDVLPFGAHDDLRKQFQELMLRRDIGIKHKPY